MYMFLLYLFYVSYIIILFIISYAQHHFKCTCFYYICFMWVTLLFYLLLAMHNTILNVHVFIISVLCELHYYFIYY